AELHGFDDPLRARRNGCNGRRTSRIQLLRAWWRDRVDIQHRTLARSVDSSHLGARSPLSLRAEPRKAAMALDHLGQRRRSIFLVGRLDTIFLVCRELW